MTLVYMTVVGAGAAGAGEPAAAAGETIHLFNGQDLTNFYSFIKGRGRNTDPLGVFTVKDGLIRVSGQEWGCLTTEQEFSDYHLVVEFKWGEQTFPPRVANARDNGILLHSVGEDGAFGETWMHSIECQLIEGGTGDLLVVGDNSDAFAITCPVAPEKQGDCYIYQPGGNPATIHGGRISWCGQQLGRPPSKGFRGKQDAEKPVGEWNRLECITKGATIRVILNGVVVNECSEAKPAKGRIQIQSEGAEAFFRKVDLTPLNAK